MRWLLVSFGGAQGASAGPDRIEAGSKRSFSGLGARTRDEEDFKSACYIIQIDNPTLSRVPRAPFGRNRQKTRLSWRSVAVFVYPILYGAHQGP